MGLYDDMGGREWARAAGVKLDGPPSRGEVRLELPAGSACGANRCGLTAKVLKGGRVVYAATWYAVGDEEAEVVREDVADSAEGLARLVAADLGVGVVAQAAA